MIRPLRGVIAAAGVLLSACGTSGPPPGDGQAPEGEDEGAGGALVQANVGGAGGAVSGSGGGSSGSGNASSSSGNGSSGTGAGSSGSGSSGNCSIMSSNQVCADCLANDCCMVINAAMDEDLYSAIECIDCYLEGLGDACCDETIGHNDWIEECVAFNCANEC